MAELPANSNFSAALAVWKEVNLHELQRTLDAQGLEIVENQKENLVGRKKLAEQTREFKKVPDEEKGPVFKTLLKGERSSLPHPHRAPSELTPVRASYLAYQTEIDNLTRRGKVAESAFLSVYKLLAEAPDPYPLLDAAVDQTAKASEARVLESELARQKDEIASLKQQLVESQSIEKERKKLADKVEKLEGKVHNSSASQDARRELTGPSRRQMEDMIQEKVSAKEAELHATYDERLRNYDEREKDLQRQVTVARSQLRELRTTADTSQARLLDNSQRQDQETIARLAEADLITQDLERTNSRVAEVERRNEKLRAEIEAVRSGSESATRVAVLESQVSDLEDEASRLMRSLDAQKELFETERAETSKKLEALERDQTVKDKEIEGLREKAKQFADYDELRRELEIMKYVEFAGMNLDDVPGESGDSVADLVRLPDPNADKANQQRGKPLENLLMAKNRKLQDELTALRPSEKTDPHWDIAQVAHDELALAHQSIGADFDGLQSRFEEQRALNDRLENDLLRINESRSGVSPMAAGREDPLAGLQLGKNESTAPTPAPFQSSAETSILPIITSQRDRFRQRNAELEEVRLSHISPFSGNSVAHTAISHCLQELRRQFNTISELRAEIKTLQTDNLKLYEKVRYLQSYRDEGFAARQQAGFSNIVRGDEELGKYQNKYEESMNPFEAFRGRERGRAIHMLNPLEKVLLSLSTVVLSNRITRNLFVMYALALHFIVLSTLYSYTLTSDAGQQVVQPVP
ncbi:SPOSA6832_03735 [Sporobolomyces salmonicolor]|uniref:Protein CASP n=1 Tax=Sporidiobolus salmonicolor TaxID=5005 RepID=A0A0D6EQ19_SPOSA|nr:SPOSA6832_03735 [Sporobolomyces salmonicolor]